MNSTLLNPAQSAEEFNRKYPVGSTVTITYYGVERKTTIENKAVVIDGLGEWIPDNITLVGNIHDNPELTNSKNQIAQHESTRPGLHI